MQCEGVLWVGDGLVGGCFCNLGSCVVHARVVDGCEAEPAAKQLYSGSGHHAPKKVFVRPSNSAETGNVSQSIGHAPERQAVPPPAQAKQQEPDDFDEFRQRMMQQYKYALKYPCGCNVFMRRYQLIFCLVGFDTIFGLSGIGRTLSIIHVERIIRNV